MAAQNRSNLCPLCGNGTIEAYRSSAELGRCQRCRLVLRRKLPTPKGLEALYDREYFEGGKEDFGYLDYGNQLRAAREDAQRKLALLERFVPPGRLLDVGCAMGHFLSVAQKRWQVIGKRFLYILVLPPFTLSHCVQLAKVPTRRPSEL